jgi:hypothetical protein
MNPYKEAPSLLAMQRIYGGKDKLLYFNFELHTTDIALYEEHTSVRRSIFRTLIENGFQKTYSKQMTGYLQELSEYQFCACPPGMGIDTHRVWEALMVGTIPIVLTSPLNELYTELPVVIVDSFEAITPETLRMIYGMMHAPGVKYNFSKLYMPYWDSYFGY